MQGKIQKINASENSENACLQVKIQKMYACKWKFRKCMLASENSENVMLASENSENVCLQVKIQKINACKWKFRKCNACKWKFRKLMLASENSEN